MANPSVDLKAWDAAMSAKKPDAVQLCQQIQAAEEATPGNVELLWRVAFATYQVSLDSTDEASIKMKTNEAFAACEKALALDANHFQSNLWMAVAAGKLALLGSNLQARVKYTVAFLRSLAVCVRLNPSDPFVLFMEGRMQLALATLTDEEKGAIRAQVDLPAVDWVRAEAKLRESIQLNGAFIDGYITLAYLLLKVKKLPEALAIVKQGLTVERLTKSDEEVADELGKMQARLEQQ